MTDPIISWSYTGRPSSNNRDAVRYLLGDTDPGDKRLGDEEVNFSLAEEPNIYFAAAACALTLAARYANRVDKNVGDLSIRFGQLRQNYLSLAGELKARGAIRGAGFYAGGITRTDRDRERQSTERIQPAFSVGMDDRTGDSDDDRSNLEDDERP